MTPVEKARDILNVIDVAHANGIAPNLAPLEYTLKQIRTEHAPAVDPHGYRSIFFVAIAVVFVIAVVGGSFALGLLTGVSSR